MIDAHYLDCKSHKMKVVFIVNQVSCWDKSQPVYDKLSECELVELIILVVPSQFENDPRKKCMQTYEYFQRRYPNVHMWYQKNEGATNLENLNPDYVFYPKPYPQSVPMEISPANVIKYSKTVYIPYALTGTTYWDEVPLQYESFFKSIYFYFTDTKNGLEVFEKTNRYKSEINKGLLNIKFLGYPVLESALKQNKDQFRLGNEFILWTPRWGYGKPQGGSHFFEYKEVILELGKKHINEKIVIRPHPDMANELIYRKKMISRYDYDNYFQRAIRSGIELDENGSVIDTLVGTKILITDYSSIMIEFFLNGIPIIYCESPDVELNSLFQKIVDANYVVKDEESLIETVENILTDGDYKYEQRLKLIEEIKKEHLGAAERIVYTILEDYKKTGGKRKASVVAAEKLSSAVCKSKGEEVPTKISNEKLLIYGEYGTHSVEAVLDKAYRYMASLDDGYRISPKKIDKGWLTRFTILAGYVEDDYMQNVWAKVLVAEIIMPGSVSMRTLSILRDMSKEELERLVMLSKYMINNEFLFDDADLNTSYGISYENDILNMDSMGVLKAFANLSVNAVAGANPSILIRTKNHVILIRKKIELGDRRVSFKYYPLTQAGREMANIVGMPLDERYFLNVVHRIKEMNVEAVVSLHAITEDFGSGVFFDKVSLV